MTFERGNNQRKLYKNGMLVHEQILAPYQSNLNDGILVGAIKYDTWGSLLYSTSGFFDDVGIWNRSLLEGEVTALYQWLATPGCMEENACNYDPEALWSDGLCDMVSCHCLEGTTWDESLGGCIPLISAETACGEGTVWDTEAQHCVIANPSDTDFDGCVSMTDLLDLLSVFGTCNEIPWSCGDHLEYQGYDYETVQIGEQCWFAENCRFMPFVGGGFQEEPSVLVYGYDGDSVEEAQETLTYDMYGALYNFASATQLGLCPQGWHVPSKIEFDELFANHGGIDQAHFQVMQEQAWNVDLDLADEGFSLLPAGWLYLSFAEVGESAYMWTSTPYGENDPRGYAWNIQELNQFQVVYEGASRAAGQSVRCIQDSE